MSPPPPIATAVSGNGNYHLPVGQIERTASVGTLPSRAASRWCGAADTTSSSTGAGIVGGSEPPSQVGSPQAVGRRVALGASASQPAVGAAAEAGVVSASAPAAQGPGSANFPPPNSRGTTPPRTECSRSSSSTLVPPLHSTGNMRAPSPDAGLIQRSLSSKCVAGAGRSAEAYAPLQVPQATVCSIQPGIQVSAPCLPRTLQQTGSYADVTNVIPPGVCGASTPTVQEPQSRPRSPSPPAIQGENTFNDVQAVYARSLRERDDEIVRLKEQVRIVSLTPKLSPSSGDATAGRRRLFEENIKLKRDVAQLQDALKGQPEDTTPPLEDSVAVISDGSCATCMTAVEPQRGFPSRSPRSSWTARVMQLQRQLKEKEDDAKCMEESLCAKIHRLEARLEQLQMQREQHQQVFLGEEEHPVPVEEISGRDADLTCRVETDVGMDGQDDRPVTVIRRALCGHQEKPKHCVDHPLAARRERQRLEEEVRRMES